MGFKEMVWEMVAAQMKRLRGSVSASYQDVEFSDRPIIISLDS